MRRSCRRDWRQTRQRFDQTDPLDSAPHVVSTSQIHCKTLREGTRTDSECKTDPLGPRSCTDQVFGGSDLASARDSGLFTLALRPALWARHATRQPATAAGRVQPELLGLRSLVGTELIWSLSIPSMGWACDCVALDGPLDAFHCEIRFRQLLRVRGEHS